MKPVFSLIVLLATANSVFAQTASPDPYAEKLVTSLVTSGDNTPILSVQEKAINRLGDSAAMGLIRYVGTQTPTPKQITKILSVINMAFAAPEAINSDADREPKATLLLLSYLSLLPTGVNAKGEIAHTQSYIQQQISDYKAKHPSSKN